MAQNPNYFPLEEGNQWVYAVAERAGAWTATVEVSRTKESGGRLYSLYSGFDGQQWYRSGTDGTLYWWDGQSVNDVAVGSFLDDKSVFSPRPAVCGQSGRIVTRAGKYKGPIGEFTNALEIQYTPGSCADAGITNEIYLPWIGMVQRTVTTIAGPRVYDLVYARLGGVTVVSGPEVSFSLALNRTVLTTADRLSARLTVRATRVGAVPIVFPSGQIYDLAIRNEKGDRVYLWSLGKMFPAVVMPLDLQGEKNYVVDVPLNQIAAGKYVVEAWLTTSGGREWMATAPLEIR